MLRHPQFPDVPHVIPPCRMVHSHRGVFVRQIRTRTSTKATTNHWVGASGRVCPQVNSLGVLEAECLVNIPDVAGCLGV